MLCKEVEGGPELSQLRKLRSSGPAMQSWGDSTSEAAKSRGVSIQHKGKSEDNST